MITFQTLKDIERFLQNIEWADLDDENLPKKIKGWAREARELREKIQGE